MNILPTPPIFIGAGAVYPYSEELMEIGARETKYDEAYNMFREFGSGIHRRIIVPRNMAPAGGADLRTEGKPVVFKSSFKARNSEQTRVIEETVKLIAQNVNFMLEAPTGFGKGACSMEIIARVGLKTLVIVTKEDIRDQWIAEAEKTLGLKLGEGIGLIQGDTCNVVNQKIVIAMVHSLAKEARYPEYVFKEFGLVLVDECHRVAADHFSQACYRIPCRKRVGISATPDRKDGREEVLEAHLGKVRVKSKAAPLTPRILIRSSPWSVPLTKVVGKDGMAKVGPVPHSPGRCGHVINMIVKCHARNAIMSKFIAAAYKSGRVTLFQSDRKDHLDIMAMMAAKEGIPPSQIGYYVGGMDKAGRDLAKTKKLILATFAMTAEATDIPWADTLVMGTPKSDVRQIVGRILRAYAGKKDPLVFDIRDDSSNVFKGYANARKDWYKSINAVLDF